MFQYEDNAVPDLETTNYRVLQAEAKKLGMPCNVKKIHLIEMLRAKRYCSDTDLKVIVDRIKMERKVNSIAKKKLKKKRLQGPEVSSTSQSPPLSLNPKRSDFVFQYNPDMGRSLMDYQPQPNILRTETSILQPLKQQLKSDRVLRSSNSVSRMNYRVLEQSNYFNEVKPPKTLQETVKEIRWQRLQKLDELHKEHSQKLLSIQRLKKERQMLRSSNILSSRCPLLRTRRISGSYPLSQISATFNISPTVVRRSSGKLTKINAVVQKLHSHALAKKRMSQPHPSMLQGIINCAVQHPSTATQCHIDYPNKTGYQIAKQPTQIEPFNQTARKNIYRAIEWSKADQSNLNCHVTEMLAKTENQEYKTAAKVIVQRNSQLFEYQNSFERGESQGIKTAAKVVVHRNSQIIEYQNGQISSNVDGIFERGENQGIKTAAKVVVHRNSQIIEYQNGQISSNVDGIFERGENQGIKTAAKVVVHRNSQIIEYQNSQISSNIDETMVLQSTYDQQKPKQGCNMEYQNENLQGQWKIYDINGQSLNSTGMEHFHRVFPHKPNKTPVFAHKPTPVFSQKPKDTPIFEQNPIDTPVSTYKPKPMVRVSNMKVVKKLGEPMSTDYQSEYKKFKQELCKNSHTKRNCAVVKPNYTKKPTVNQRKRLNQHMIQTYSNQQQNSGPICHQIQDYISYTYQNQVSNINLVSQNALYPNMQAMSDHGYLSSHQVFNHKEIRAEQVQSIVLPNINDAFTQFNYSRLTQPLYVQVSQEYDRVPMPLNQVDISNTCMLETFYNFKNLLVNPHLLAIATAKTDCTYSCKTVTTPLEMPAVQLNINPDLPPYQPPPPPPPPPANTYHSNEPGVPSMVLDEPLLTHAECDEVLSSWSTTSVDPSQSSQNDDNSTVLDMMEELISQDGEYMEQIIKLDVTVKCCVIVCDWIGFKSTLEHHIQLAHVQDIQQPLIPEWSVLLTLGELLPRQSWASQLSRFGDELYALSAKYSNDDTIQIALSIIPNEMDTDVEIIRRGRITIYNKISGKPYTFEGEIHHIPDCMPDECDLECLSVKIGDLDLMPNSANLKLVNTELVGTPDKVIFGQPQLNEVEIVVYIKLFN